MIIDGNAHSCGIFYHGENVIKILDALHIDKVALCTNFENNDKNQSLPDLAKWFPGSDVMLPMNRIIRLVNKIAAPKPVFYTATNMSLGWQASIPIGSFNFTGSIPTE